MSFAFCGRSDDLLHALFARCLLFSSQYPTIEHSLGGGRVGFDDFFRLRIFRERLFQLERHVWILRNVVVMRRPRLSQLVETKSLGAHSSLFDEPLRVRERVVAPLALFIAPREVAQKSVSIEALYRRIYPAETNRATFGNLLCCRR